MRQTTALALAALLAFSAPVRAAAAVAAPMPEAVEPQPAVLDTATVRAPGPGMWKVSRGDSTLWILGTVSPLPAGMQWNARRMQSVLASADAVLYAPSVVVGADIGFFGKLALAPSLIGVRSLPDGRHLKDVLPPATWARWAELKRRHLGGDRSVERWRPIFAAEKLYGQALKQRGLSPRSVVAPALTEAMKARGLKGTPASAKLTIANPKAAVRDFKTAQLEDTVCFERMLDRVENDLDTLAARADAWAAGDIATLRRLDHGERDDGCEDALLGGAFARKYGLDSLQAQARAKWLAEAEASLGRHRTTFAVLPMHEVLSPQGLVAALAAKGYAVEAPDAAVATGDGAPAASP